MQKFSKHSKSKQPEYRGDALSRSMKAVKPMIPTWFWNLLLLQALRWAHRNGDHIIPLYCFDPRHFGGTYHFNLPKTGPHRLRFLLESVSDLRQNLQKLGRLARLNVTVQWFGYQINIGDRCILCVSHRVCLCFCSKCVCTSHAHTHTHTHTHTHSHSHTLKQHRERETLWCVWW